MIIVVGLLGLGSAAASSAQARGFTGTCTFAGPGFFDPPPGAGPALGRHSSLVFVAGGSCRGMLDGVAVSDLDFSTYTLTGDYPTGRQTLFGCHSASINAGTTMNVSFSRRFEPVDGLQALGPLVYQPAGALTHAASGIDDPRVAVMRYSLGTRMPAQCGGHFDVPGSGTLTIR